MYKLHKGDCLDYMRSSIADSSIDAVITSPPYDNLRQYGGHSWDFENIAKEIFRATTDGGVCVWVVGDSVVDGSESGNSFRQALFFMEVGFRLHDTMIYWKNAFPFPDKSRYSQVFEYMFVFSKGAPSTTNIIRVATNKENQVKSRSSRQRNPDGTTSPMKYEIGKQERNLENIWIYEVGYMKTTKNKEAFEHPAMFPESLAEDHIISWTNENMVVLDPFMGSGTVGVACEKLKRKFVGCEIEPNYFKIAEKRIQESASQPVLF